MLFSCYVMISDLNTISSFPSHVVSCFPTFLIWPVVSNECESSSQMEHIMSPKSKTRHNLTLKTLETFPRFVSNFFFHIIPNIKLSSSWWCSTFCCLGMSCCWFGQSIQWNSIFFVITFGTLWTTRRWSLNVEWAVWNFSIFPSSSSACDLNISKENFTSSAAHFYAFLKDCQSIQLDDENFEPLVIDVDVDDC